MKRKMLGVVILLLVVLAGIVYQAVFRGGAKTSADIFGRRTEVVSGYIGSEKSNLLDNPEIQAVLRSVAGLETEYLKAGSIEMISMDQSGKDYLWPSSQVALELYKLRGGTGKSTILLNSPIVLYSWDIVVDALEREKIVQKRGGTFYTVDLPVLINVVQKGMPWSQIGLDQLYGKVHIISTDPNKSNSGSMFAGLLTNILTADVATERSLPAVLPGVTLFFERLGLMEHSTGILFERFITQGVGSYPIIVGYENQIIEFALQNPAVWAKLKARLRILYPQPTVWSSHPMIALNEKGSRLMEAVSDPKFQALAWTSHGFRSGIPGMENDPAVFNIAGLTQAIDQVIPMPAPEVMERILAAIKGENQ